jgi:rod shape-determining protein MreD
MTRWSLGAASLFAALLGQLLISAAWPASLVFFDLPLLVVLYYALDRGPTTGTILGAAVGLVQDSLTESLLGAGAAARCLVGYMVGAAGMRIVLTRPLPQLLVVAGGSLAARSLELLTLIVMGRKLALPSAVDLLASAVGNGLIGGVLFAFLRREPAS